MPSAIVRPAISRVVFRMKRNRANRKFEGLGSKIRWRPGFFDASLKSAHLSVCCTTDEANSHRESGLMPHLSSPIPCLRFRTTALPSDARQTLMVWSAKAANMTVVGTGCNGIVMTGFGRLSGVWESPSKAIASPVFPSHKIGRRVSTLSRKIRISPGTLERSQ